MKQPAVQRRRRRAGFTLLEVVLAMLIASVLAYSLYTAMHSAIVVMHALRTGPGIPRATTYATAARPTLKSAPGTDTSPPISATTATIAATTNAPPPAASACENAGAGRLRVRQPMPSADHEGSQVVSLMLSPPDGGVGTRHVLPAA